MSNLNIKQRLLISFCSLIFFFGLNLGAYFWGKAQKDTELNNLNVTTDAQVTTLTLQKSIGDLKKQVGLVQQMTESAGASEITKMSEEEIKIFTGQVKSVTEKVNFLKKIDSSNQSVAQFSMAYQELESAWLKFYNLYGGPEHKKAMLTLIMEAEPAAETSLMMLDQLIEQFNERVITAKTKFNKISNLVNSISIGLFVASLLFAVFVALAVASYISKKLKALQEGANRLKDGDLEARVDASGNDELASLGKDFNSMADSLLEARNKIEAAHKETLKLQREMEQIFDTVGQAIMTFDKDLEVNELYSKETDRIMPGIEPSGKSIYDVLFNESDIAPNLKSSLESEILLSFDNDKMQWDLTDLEDAKEFNKPIQGKPRDFKVNFRPILDADENVTRVLCQVEDITEIKALQQEAQKSGKRLERVQFVTSLGLNNYPHFQKEQYGFISKLTEFLDEATNGQHDEIKIPILKRSLHTGKGNCNLLRCNELALIYHITETSLNEYLESYSRGNDIGLSEIKENHNKLLTELLALNDIFNEIYGEKSGDDSIEIKRLSWAENILLSLKNLPELDLNTRNKFQQYVDEFQYAKNMVCAGSLTKNYEIHTTRVANKIGAQYGHIKFKGFDTTLLDESVLESINEALVHTITNSVVHGYKEENILHLDDPKIKIDVEMLIQQDDLKIIIKDQGCGIDIEKVKAKAKSLSPELAEEIKNYNDNEILQLIFSPKLSTYDSEDQFAGRGIGMYAAFQAIESIGGKILVESEWTKGTNITIEIPQNIKDRISFVTILPPQEQDPEVAKAA